MPQIRPSTVLGIETSCDETAAAVVVREVDPEGRISGRILSNVVRAQLTEHAPFGGVVPEIAARAHIECLDDVIREAMRRAGTEFAALDAIAVTAGPGLVGGLMVGVLTAEAIAAVHGKPLVAVNHLAAHALTVGLTDGLRPPYLVLLVSGGHTQILEVESVTSFRRLATTIDDALGEAFDKTAKLLGLGYPGGPAVERMARGGDAQRFRFPRPMMGREEPHFSFAGLKTAVRLAAQSIAPLTDQDVADVCASFQAAVAEALADRVRRSLALVGAGRPLLTGRPHQSTLVVSGGVAANQALRQALEVVARAEGIMLAVPPPSLCTDNGVMIAWAGAERLALGLVDPSGIVVRARWPLDAEARAVLGAGRLGAKA